MNQNRIRYRQMDFHLKELDSIKELSWSLEKYGCGPTSIANVLINLGFQITPIEVAKKILFDQNENINTYYLREKGIHQEGLLYALNRFMIEEHFNIFYKVIKVDSENPNHQKQKIIDHIKNSCMAIIHVGPSNISPFTFSKYGHDLVISDVEKDNKFYVINSNLTGDEQIGKAFSYETIIQNIYGRKDSFNFLMIGKR